MFKPFKQSTLGGDTIKLTFSKAISMIVSMLVTMILSRYSTYTEYGTYSQLLLVINLASTLLTFGLPSSINYFIARSDDEKEKGLFLSVFYTLITFLSLITGLVLVLSVPFLELYFHNRNIKCFWMFLAIYPWTLIIGGTVENFLIVYKKTNVLALFRVLNCCSILGCAFIVLRFNLGFSEYLKYYLLINIFFTIVIYCIVFHLNSRIRISFNKSVIVSILAFSIPLGIASMIGTLNTEVDKLLIGYLMTTEEMAIYTNAAKELPLNIISVSVTAILLPHLTKMVKQNRGKEAVHLWCCATELSLTIISVIVSIVFVYAKDVISVLYSEKYLNGINVFRIYSSIMLLRVTYFGMILNAYGKTKKILTYTVLSLIVNVILNPMFFYFFGMIGPALATLLSLITIMVLQLISTSKITEVSIYRVYPWKAASNILLINIALGILFGYIKGKSRLDIDLGSVEESIILGGIWLVIYYFIMRIRIINNWNTLNYGGL